jgi:hypothetical protein
MNVEAYDLFGETIECSICLDQIKEGERTLRITSCQHGFHQECLDPWLLANSTCPNCRGSVRPETEITPLQRIQNQRELDRLYLTYILYSWILQTFPGVLFHRNSNAIHTFLRSFSYNDIRPIAFTMTPRNRASLSSIRALRGYLIQRESHLFQDLHPNDPHIPLHRNPTVREMSRQISSQLNLFRQSHA